MHGQVLANIVNAQTAQRLNVKADASTLEVLGGTCARRHFSYDQIEISKMNADFKRKV